MSFSVIITLFPHINFGVTKNCDDQGREPRSASFLLLFLYCPAELIVSSKNWSAVGNRGLNVTLDHDLYTGFVVVGSCS